MKSKALPPVEQAVVDEFSQLGQLCVLERAVGQSLTLIHSSAQLEHFMWDEWVLGGVRDLQNHKTEK